MLANGVRKAAEIVGNGAEKYAIHVKGLEGPAHDPRSGKLLGIATAPQTAACATSIPLKAWLTIEEDGLGHEGPRRH